MRPCGGEDALAPIIGSNAQKYAKDFIKVYKMLIGGLR